MSTNIMMLLTNCFTSLAQRLHRHLSTVTHHIRFIKFVKLQLMYTNMTTNGQTAIVMKDWLHNKKWSIIHIWCNTVEYGISVEYELYMLKLLRNRWKETNNYFIMYFVHNSVNKTYFIRKYICLF